MREQASGQRRQVRRHRGEGRGRASVEGDLYTQRVWQVEATYLVNGVYRTHTKQNMTLDEMDEWKRHLACEVETCVQAIGGRMS